VTQSDVSLPVNLLTQSDVSQKHTSTLHHIDIDLEVRCDCDISVQ